MASPCLHPIALGGGFLGVPVMTPQSNLPGPASRSGSMIVEPLTAAAVAAASYPGAPPTTPRLPYEPSTMMPSGSAVALHSPAQPVAPSGHVVPLSCQTPRQTSLVPVSTHGQPLLLPSTPRQGQLDGPRPLLLPVQLPPRISVSSAQAPAHSPQAAAPSPQSTAAAPAAPMPRAVEPMAAQPLRTPSQVPQLQPPWALAPATVWAPSPPGSAQVPLLAPVTWHSSPAPAEAQTSPAPLWALPPSPSQAPLPAARLWNLTPSPTLQPQATAQSAAWTSSPSPSLIPWAGHSSGPQQPEQGGDYGSRASAAEGVRGPNKAGFTPCADCPLREWCLAAAAAADAAKRRGEDFDPFSENLADNPFNYRDSSAGPAPPMPQLHLRSDPQERFAPRPHIGSGSGRRPEFPREAGAIARAALANSEECSYAPQPKPRAAWEDEDRAQKLLELTQRCGPPRSGLEGGPGEAGILQPESFLDGHSAASASAAAAWRAFEGRPQQQPADARHQPRLPDPGRPQQPMEAPARIGSSGLFPVGNAASAGLNGLLDVSGASAVTRAPPTPPLGFREETVIERAPRTWDLHPSGLSYSSTPEVPERHGLIPDIEAAPFLQQPSLSSPAFDEGYSRQRASGSSDSFGGPRALRRQGSKEIYHSQIRPLTDRPFQALSEIAQRAHMSLVEKVHSRPSARGQLSEGVLPVLSGTGNS